jgi:two-component system sensor histidine kinase VicK
VSSGAAQLRFAADFGVFLVAGAGITLLLLRPALLVSVERARAAVAVGFALLAGASVAHGGGLVDELDHPALVVARVVGALLVAASALRWPGTPTGRAAIGTGLFALLAADLALAVDAGSAADAIRLIGAGAVGVGVFIAARRSIPARIATSASAILLSVVLGVSVGLSAVLADNVEDEAANRLESDAGTEAARATETYRLALASAAPAARALGSASASPELIELLTRLRDPAAPITETDASIARTNLEALVESLIAGIDPSYGPVLLVSADPGAPRRYGFVTPAGSAPDEATLAQLQANAVVEEAITRDDQRASIVTAGSTAFGLAAVPVRIPDGTGRVTAAVVVVTSRLDAGYLQARQVVSRASDDRGLAIVSRSAVIAGDGNLPDADSLTALAAEAMDGAGTVTRTIGDRLVTAEQVLGADDAPVFAAITSVSTATIQATRSDLFDLLFLIASGTTLLALVLAAVIGERIGAGLRELTVAAGEITSGNLLVSPQVRSDDELGVLSTAFSSMTGSLRGMTAELRQAADDEARLRTRMEGVVGGMGDALVAVDEHGDITDFNVAAELLTGVAARKAIGRPAGTVVRMVGDDGADLSARLGAPPDEGWTSPATVVHTTGIDVPVVVSAGVLRGANQQLAGAVYVLRDVRREREIERLKSEFLANISHELRTPLSPIKGYSQILRTRDIPMDDVRRFANEIEKASGRLERVVVQLVNFASMSAGRFEVRTEPVLLREVLDRVVGRWSDRVDPALFSISRRVARGISKVWLDRQSIDQALDELVDNAVKYSPDGGKIELIATLGTADGSPVVRIAVIDRGVGIPADRIDDVLGDFTQADGSNTRSFGGLGLGLALVGRIARAHGGDIEVASAEGKGTAVTIVLPVGGAA